MFGKRSTNAAPPPPRRETAPTPSQPVPILSEPDKQLRQEAPVQEEMVISADEKRKSDEYYATKSMVFGALIEAIDLAQLARLDQEAARDEIRDIVN